MTTKELGANPTNPTDTATKKYVDDLTKSAVAGNLAVPTTVETVVLKILIPAGSAKVGSTLDFSLFMKPAVTTITTTRVRVGTTGTTSDAALVTVCATAATNLAARYVRGVVGVQAIGASATILGGGVETVGTITATGAQSTTSGTFNSTVDNWISVTVQNTSSTTTTVSGARAEFTY